MKKLLFGLLMFTAARGWGAIAFSTSTFACGNGSSVTTGGLNTTGANFIVMCVGNAVGTITVSDSKSNVWTSTTAYDNGTRSQLFYSSATSVGTGHTFTASGSFPSVVVLAFSGVATGNSVIDKGTGGGFSSATSGQPGSITPASNNELLVSCMNWGSGITGPTVNSSFSSPPEFQNFTGGACYGSGGSYLIQTTAGAANPTWSWTTAASGALSIESFNAAAVVNPTYTYVPLLKIRGKMGP